MATYVVVDYLYVSIQRIRRSTQHCAHSRRLAATEVPTVMRRLRRIMMMMRLKKQQIISLLLKAVMRVLLLTSTDD